MTPEPSTAPVSLGLCCRTMAASRKTRRRNNALEYQLSVKAELSNIVNHALHVFPKSFINRNNEIILEPRNNVYFRLDNVETALEFKCKMFAWVSRPIAKGLNKYWAPRVLRSFNELLGTNFTKDEMYEIYDRLGNDINRKLTIQFIESNYDLSMLKRPKATESTELPNEVEAV